ncbi:MAG: MarR family transcriptional regulator [Caulobacterales bacterium]|nr:MarR family transcriptional regulator [Caulobacterales bacterium]
MTSDIPLRDTPALAVLSRRSAALGDIDPAALAAAQDFLRVAKRMLGAFRQAFDAHGLSPGRYSALMALDVERPSLAPSEIADRLGVTRATVTGLIDGLLRDGLVAYAAEGADRRRKAITLTARGEALIEVVVPVIFRRMADMMAPLSPDERQTAVRLLGKVEAGLLPARAIRAREEADT